MCTAERTFAQGALEFLRNELFPGLLSWGNLRRGIPTIGGFIARRPAGAENSPPEPLERPSCPSTRWDD